MSNVPDDTVRLAGYFEEIYEYLVESGVPEDRLPTPWHVLSRVVQFIDGDMLSEWLNDYVKLEADLSADEDPPHAEPHHRPSYLRALDKPEKPEPQGA